MATEQTKVGESAEQTHKLRELIEDANLHQANAYEQANNLDKISQAINAEGETGRKITDDDRRDVIELADTTMEQRQSAIGGNDPSTRVINDTPERRHQAAMAVASALANHDAKANNEFRNEELRKIYDRERQFEVFRAKQQKPENKTLLQQLVEARELHHYQVAEALEQHHLTRMSLEQLAYTGELSEDQFNRQAEAADAAVAKVQASGEVEKILSAPGTEQEVRDDWDKLNDYEARIAEADANVHIADHYVDMAGWSKEEQEAQQGSYEGTVEEAQAARQASVTDLAVLRDEFAQWKAMKGVVQEAALTAEPRMPSAETVREATEDRRLELSEAAREQFDRFQRKEIEYSKIKETDELEEGYEINRLVAHSRLQQDRLEKGEITPDELAKDDESREGRELDKSIEKARARRIEQEEERGEIEATKTSQSKEAEGNNQIQDFDAMAATQARHKMPEDVERDFPRHKAGDARTHYYGKDPDRVAFVDKGDKMQTPRDFDQQGVRAMVDIAKARGWEEVKVRGSESFRHQVYLEAAKRGIEVKGYKPTEAEKKVAERDSRNYKRNQDAADAFRDASTREEKAEAAEKHGQLAKAYAIERSLQAWERKNNIPEANRVKLEKNLHDMIEKDLRDGKNLASVRVRNRKQEQQVQRQEEAEQVR